MKVRIHDRAVRRDHGVSADSDPLGTAGDGSAVQPHAVLEDDLGACRKRPEPDAVDSGGAGAPRVRNEMAIVADADFAHRRSDDDRSVYLQVPPDAHPQEESFQAETGRMPNRQKPFPDLIDKKKCQTIGSYLTLFFQDFGE